MGYVMSHILSEASQGTQIFFWKKQNVYPKILYPRPSPASTFVTIVLSSKWTGVSLKGCRQNWQERGPGEEKDNRLLNPNCNM